MFICRVMPLLLTSKILCAGGFQITLSGIRGDKWSLSLELASNSCLAPSGSQLLEQRSPVRLVLLKSMPRLTNRTSIAMPVVVCPPCSSREHAFFQTCIWIFCSLSPSLPLFLLFSSLLFRVFSSAVSLSLFLYLSLSYLLFSLVSLFPPPPSLSLSVSLSLSLSLSLSPSLFSPSLLFLISISRTWFTSSQSLYYIIYYIIMNFLDFFHCFSVFHPNCTC